MALYDSASLLEKFRDYADRPSTDEDLTDAKVYRFLTDAQIPVFQDIMARWPRLLMGAPVLMTSADGGVTYTIGTDSEGDNIYPFGHAEVYATSPNGRELYASTYAAYSGDFVFEGYRLRTPAGNSYTYSSGPYIRYVAQPLTISASSEPTLQPKQHRNLILFQALVNWANVGGHRDPRPYQQMYDRAWSAAVVALTTQYRQAAQAERAGVLWWRYWLDQGGLGSSGDFLS